MDERDSEEDGERETEEERMLKLDLEEKGAQPG